MRRSPVCLANVILRPLTREDTGRLGPGCVATFAHGSRPLPGRCSELHFAVELRPTGDVAGVLSLFDIDWKTRSAAAGTWLAPSWRGRGVNKKAKALLLDRAFWDLGLKRVRFETASDNLRSRRALESLGAVADGVVPGGVPGDSSSRDLLLYSIWRDEDQ